MKSMPESEQFEAELRDAITAISSRISDDVYDRLRSHRYLPRRHPVRHALLAVTPVAAALLVVALLKTGSGPGTHIAFAGWSATPTAPAPGQVTTANRTCVTNAGKLSADQRHIVIETPHGTMITTSQFGAPDGSWTPVVDDTRGPYTLVVMTRASTTGTNRGACLTGPGSLADHPQLHLAAGMANSQPLPDALGDWGLGRGAEGDTILLGLVGTDVRSVTLTLSDGKTVRATVANSTYAAWWPGPAYPTAAVASTATGATTTEPLGAPPSQAGGIGGSGAGQKP